MSYSLGRQKTPSISNSDFVYWLNEWQYVMKADSYFDLIHKLFQFLEHKYKMEAGIDI